MKFKMMIVFVFVIMLSTPIALATSVYSEYEGSGDFFMKTTISSSATPTLIDTVESHTACDEIGCCCPNCCLEGDGGYNGQLMLSNNPSEWSEHYGEVDNGCIEIIDEIVDTNGDQVVTTYYNTGVKGTGYAYSAVAAKPSSIYSYQYSEGSGDLWAYVSKYGTFNGDFDYEATYGGVIYQCDNGYVFLANDYLWMTPYTLQLICDNYGEVNGFIHAISTDSMNLSVDVTSDYMSWFMDTDVDGQAIADVTVSSNGELNMGFDLVLG